MKTMFILKTKLVKFLNNKRGSDDKQAGTAMAMIFSVVVGFFILTKVLEFLDVNFLPEVFSKITDALNFSGN